MTAHSLVRVFLDLLCLFSLFSDILLRTYCEKTFTFQYRPFGYFFKKAKQDLPLNKLSFAPNRLRSISALIPYRICTALQPHRLRYPNNTIGIGLNENFYWYSGSMFP